MTELTPLDGQADIIRSTRQLRKRIHVTCPRPDDQRCHNTGLNLIKLLLNYYTTVRDVTLDADEMRVLKHDINDPRLNIRCCSEASNEQDKVLEAEVLDYIFRHRPGDTVETMSSGAQHMFRELVTMLRTVKQHASIRHDTPHISLILDDVEHERFPLRRFCFECHSPVLATASAFLSSNRFAFCRVMCRVSYGSRNGPLR